jgi:hypothetical protein
MSQPMTRLPGATLAVLLLIAVSIAGCAASNEYHEAKMKEAHTAMLVNPHQNGELTAYEIDEPQQKRFEKHRDILINRGVLFKEVYVFGNVKSTTPAAHAVIKTLLQSPPCPVVDFSSPYADKSQPLEITLWGWQEDQEKWDQFMRNHDTPVQAGGAAAGSSR